MHSVPRIETACSGVLFSWRALPYLPLWLRMCLLLLSSPFAALTSFPLSVSLTALDTFKPKSAKDFEDFGKAIANKYFVPYAGSTHYKLLMKQFCRAALQSLSAAETKDIETSIAGAKWQESWAAVERCDGAARLAERLCARRRSFRSMRLRPAHVRRDRADPHARPAPSPAPPRLVPSPPGVRTEKLKAEKAQANQGKKAGKKATLNVGRGGGAAGLDDYVFDNSGGPDDDYDFM